MHPDFSKLFDYTLLLSFFPFGSPVTLPSCIRILLPSLPSLDLQTEDVKTAIDLLLMFLKEVILSYYPGNSTLRSLIDINLLICNLRRIPLSIRL